MGEVAQAGEAAEGQGGAGTAACCERVEPPRYLIRGKFPPKKGPQAEPCLDERRLAERCLDLAGYFYPELAVEFRRVLAKRLQDTADYFERDLCHCQLSTCGALFLKVQRGVGAPRRQYCCREHAIEGDREQARVRMSNARAAR